ncbi:hypothetical protein GCM10009831_11580 [Dietzia cercidiphylli]|uniref:Uncharacterized protein n=1 Tax=Dietzia cercidiphylli TaxID=498199 RepID=A0ABN2IEZ0_9ACTN
MNVTRAPIRFRTRGIRLVRAGVLVGRGTRWGAGGVYAGMAITLRAGSTDAGALTHMV